MLADMKFDKPSLMGIVNVTPDSFSDGGLYFDPAQAVSHGLKLIAEGADILDIGGESTRPGANPVTIDEEITRVIPVIKGLAGQGALISIDTRHAATMQAAIDAGAGMINDITALRGDRDSLAIAAAADVPVCLMHMQGEPRTMQVNPEYADVTQDVLSFLLQQAGHAQAAGVKKENIILDPGIGFGKNLDHNLDLLKHIETFTRAGYPVLLGASRKSFISKLMEQDAPPENRLGGSLATVLRGLDAGVAIFRVHDIAATRQAIKVWQEIAFH
jgi:dihydropteroate synthase